MDADKYFENVRSYMLLAKKEVGQNFLVDPRIAKAIVDALEVRPGDKILEIGPGAGSLSYFLAQGEGDCTLLDIDEALIAKLEKDFGGNGRIHPVKGNALEANFGDYDRLIGNLPYYITTSLLEKAVVEARMGCRAVFMIQKEVFRRVLAKPGEEGFGPLSILLALSADIERLMSVSPGAFVPVPHVESLVFSLSFSRKIDFDKASFLAFAKRLFLHRRKRIFFDLSALVDKEKAFRMLEEAGIAQGERAENVPPSRFLRLFEEMKR